MLSMVRSLSLGQRFALYALLNGFAVLVHLVQLRGHFRAALASSVSRHSIPRPIVQTPRSIQARPQK